jgi:hypothetical protein
MAVHRKCLMETFTDQGQLEDRPCQVRISEGTISVSHEEGGETLVYEGAEVEPGHFKLGCPPVKGYATLHRFKDDDVLDGWYVQEGFEGMWRVRLDEE